jgi:tryptophan-rich sensory protein
MTRQLSKVSSGIGFAALTYGAGLLGALWMRKRPRGLWYRLLRKPSYQPPPWVFAPVWNVLYGAIAYSGNRLYRAPSSRARTVGLGLWAAQLALNAAWTPIFFGARRARLALLDLALLDATVAAYAAVSSRVDRRAAVAVVPYLGWLGLATALNGSIVRNNPALLTG